MTPTNRVVDKAARAVLDGIPVDWGGLESAVGAETDGLAAQLRVLSAIAHVHRSAPVPASDTSPSSSGPGPDLTRPFEEWGHLRLLETVGSGAFGDVYRAWDTRLDREVALKLLRANTTREDRPSPIIQEGRLLARVRHPNIATIYGADLIGTHIGLWMEFIHGRTLEELLRSGHRFSVSEVMEIGLEVCRAVSAVHAAGLLHRDIKAQNVMRADDGRVVLMDFGTGLDMTDGGQDLAGTPLYLAPEVLRGEPATVRSDVYSVGVLLYHLLTGGYPIDARTLEDLRRAHERTAGAESDMAPRALHPRVASVVRRAIDADPVRRYASCEALAADLRAGGRRTRLRRPAALALIATGVVLTVWLGSKAFEFSASDPRGDVRGADATVGLAETAVAAPERPVIAVLPFENRRSEPDGELIADGLTYELIRDLAVVDGLDVRSATSTFALKGKVRDVAEVARQLGVNTAIEGSVAGSGDVWRVTVRMVRANSATPPWSRTFEVPGEGAPGVQHLVARAVANELRLTLGAGQRRYDLDWTTWSVYLKARALVERRGTKSATAAAELFGEVIARDPTYAPAHAGLADAYAFMSTDLPDVRGLPYEDALALMRSAAETALALDPLLAEAHAAMGFLYSREFAWADAEEAFRRAIDLNPSLTHAYTSYSTTTLMPLGRLDEAETLLREALRRDPLSLTVLRDLAEVQINAGRYDEAIENLEDIIAVDPSLTYVDLHLARALTFAGRLDEAMPIWEARSGDVGRQHWMAIAYVHAGRRAEIERLVSEHDHPYRLAMLYAALGDEDQALGWLERAAEDVPQRVVWLLGYPEMATLRGAPRFEDIRARFGLR